MTFAVDGLLVKDCWDKQELLGWTRLLEWTRLLGLQDCQDSQDCQIAGIDRNCWDEQDFEINRN